MLDRVRKFRFSLGTLLLLTLTASALIKLNLSGIHTADTKIGWPFQIFEATDKQLTSSTTYQYDEVGRITAITPEAPLNLSRFAADVLIFVEY